jgi:hypothetical protein
MLLAILGYCKLINVVLIVFKEHDKNNSEDERS